MVTLKVLGVRLDPMRSLFEKLPNVSAKINYFRFTVYPDILNELRIIKNLRVNPLILLARFAQHDAVQRTHKRVAATTLSAHFEVFLTLALSTSASLPRTLRWALFFIMVTAFTSNELSFIIYSAFVSGSLLRSSHVTETLLDDGFQIQRETSYFKPVLHLLLNETGSKFFEEQAPLMVLSIVPVRIEMFPYHEGVHRRNIEDIVEYHHWPSETTAVT